MTRIEQPFVDALLDPSAEAPPGLMGPRGTSAKNRFGVYRNNVHHTLIQALALAFPVVAKLIGRRNFQELAIAFLRTHPPPSPVLAVYGREMSEFLENFAPLTQLGYLPDIARLEQNLRLSYHAADEAPIDATDLEAMPIDLLMASPIKLAASVFVMRSEWPLFSIWAYNTFPNEAKPAPTSECVLITRPRFDPVPEAVSFGTVIMIDALQRGEPLGAALERAETEPDFSFERDFGRLLTQNAIVGFGHYCAHA